jgi:hypothetical protein
MHLRKTHFYASSFVFSTSLLHFISFRLVWLCVPVSSVGNGIFVLRQEFQDALVSFAVGVARETCVRPVKGRSAVRSAAPVDVDIFHLKNILCGREFIRILITVGIWGFT